MQPPPLPLRFYFYSAFWHGYLVLSQYHIIDSELLGCRWERMYENDDVFEQTTVRTIRNLTPDDFLYTPRNDRVSS